MADQSSLVSSAINGSIMKSKIWNNFLLISFENLEHRFWKLEETHVSWSGSYFKALRPNAEPCL